MILSFYVKGSEEASQASTKSYLEEAQDWLNALPDLTFDDAMSWSKETATELWDKTTRAFKYLTGAPVPPTSTATTERQAPEQPQKKERSAWDFVGVFSSLKGSSSKSVVAPGGAEHQKFTAGEVHADLVRVSRMPAFV
mgnify:CR=1 FL=1